MQNTKIPKIGSTIYGKNKLLCFSLSWAFTVHKYQGNTLGWVIIDLGKSENYCGIMLVALSRVLILRYLLLDSLSFELFKR